MPTLTVELTPEAGALLQAKLADGGYADASAALSDAVMAWGQEAADDDEPIPDWHLERLAVSIAQYERGEFVETSLEDLIRKARARMGLADE